MPVTIPLPQEGLPSETENNLLDCVISFIFRNYKKVKISINLSVNNLFMFNWFVTCRSGSRIFLRRGCTTKEWRNRPVTLTNVYRIPVVLESHLDAGGGRGLAGRGAVRTLLCTLPLVPPLICNPPLMMSTLANDCSNIEKKT